MYPIQSPVSVKITVTADFEFIRDAHMKHMYEVIHYIWNVSVNNTYMKHTQTFFVANDPLEIFFIKLSTCWSMSETFDDSNKNNYYIRQFCNAC